MKRPRWTGLSKKTIGSHTLYMRAYRAAVRERSTQQPMPAKAGSKENAKR